MTTKTLCLFRCTSVKTYEKGFEGVRQYEFWAQYDDNIPEEKRFAQATPSGKVEITVDNPAVTYEVGKKYYFTIEEKI